MKSVARLLDSSNMLKNGKKDEECGATDDDSSNAAGQNKTN